MNYGTSVLLSGSPSAQIRLHGVTFRGAVFILALPSTRGRPYLAHNRSLSSNLSNTVLRRRELCKAWSGRYSEHRRLTLRALLLTCTFRNHEMEKQYVCQYCHNRFKNKNEAERHQNSLHVRRYSWSCAALTSFEATFHPTTTPTSNIAPSAATDPAMYPPPAATDTCGYCGMEFSNPPNWDARVEHLNHVHKFGECNQNKKFFRADHFRQHLKHSHGGTSGRWTNMLETACMREELPPQPTMSHPSYQVAMAPPMVAPRASPRGATSATLPPMSGSLPAVTTAQQISLIAQATANLPPQHSSEEDR